VWNACLIVAAVGAYMPCLFLGMLLEMSGLGSVATFAWFVGPVATAVACIVLGRLTRSASPIRAGLLTLTFTIAPTVIAFGALVAVEARYGSYGLDGPDSPAGHHVHLSVRNCLGIGADFYTDVRVVDANGATLAEWRDRQGQVEWGGAEQLRDSMRWRDARVLEFTTRSGAERLELK
jgi:hypothetical protein